VRTVSMQVPETAMHENDFEPRSENQIGATRQVLSVQAIPVSHPMNQPAHSKLWRGVLGPYKPHPDTSLGSAQYIHATAP